MAKMSSMVMTRAPCGVLSTPRHPCPREMGSTILTSEQRQALGLIDQIVAALTDTHKIIRQILPTYTHPANLPRRIAKP